MKEYKICKRCVMDTSDPIIKFDKNGYCNLCTQALENKIIVNEESEKKFETLIKMLKEEGKNKPYDCVLGLSGGIDSSYLAYLLSKKGVRILGIHIDAGWDTPTSCSNLKKLVKKCKIELKTIKINETEMMDLQRAYFLAQVINQDVPQDHAFFAELYHYMMKHKIKYFISGHNWVSESITPLAWGYDAYDSDNLKDIHKKYGKVKLKTYPILTFFENKIKMPYICKIKKLRPLNYINYDPNKALEILIDEVGFEYYGSKHCESSFTRLLQTYIQPKKFGFEKRRAHLSSMIISGLITRDEALKILSENPGTDEQIEKDINEFITKIGITRNEFDEIVNSKTVVPHTSFKTNEKKLKIFNFIKKLIRR